MALALRAALLIRGLQRGRQLAGARSERKQVWFERADQLGPIVYGYVGNHRPVELKQQRTGKVLRREIGRLRRPLGGAAGHGAGQG